MEENAEPSHSSMSFVLLVCRRGFVQFVYEPIKTVIECCMADNREKLWKLTDSLGVTPRLKSEDKDLVSRHAAALYTQLMREALHIFGLHDLEGTSACVSNLGAVWV